MIIKRIYSRYKDWPVFTYGDVKRFLRISDGRLREILHYMIKTNKIYSIKKGIYSFHNEPEIAGFAFKPFYYGLHNALTYLHIWDQATVPVIVTPNKVRTGERIINGQKVIVRRINAKYFFGFELLDSGGFQVPVSTPEKTLIDFVYFKIGLDKKTWGSLIKRIDKKKLKEMLDIYPKRLIKKVKNKVEL